jgi:hypothetical protein
LITLEERLLVEPVDQEDQEELADQEELVVLVEQEVMVDLAAVAVAAAQEHGLMVKVLVTARWLAEEVELVLLAELEDQPQQALQIQVDPEPQMLAGEEALQVVDPIDSAATEEI